MTTFTNYTTEAEGEKDFEKIAQSIGTNIQKISQNVASMTRMVNLLGTAQDSKDVRFQLQKVQQITQQMVKDTNNSLKDLSTIPPSRAKYEQRQRKVQQERLAEEFTTALNLFQSTQRKALKKESEQVKITRAAANSVPMSIAPPPQTDPFRDDIHPNQLIELQDNQELTQAQLEKERNDLVQLHEQEEALRMLERDINDVNQIYRDLGKLVHDQGEMIDSIEANIERTHVTVRDATSQLSKASSYATKARKKRFCLCSVLAAIVLIIFVIIYIHYN